MREIVDLLRREARARIFFLTLTQSGLGTGAGYVALLLIAYDRFESPWSVSLVLLAELVPAMLLGPVFGAAADRWSRKRCMVAADALRAVAFAGLAAVGSFEATLAFALVAGVGTGLFTPSSLAALPSVVDDERRVPAATSLYGVIDDLGFTVGPAVAAALLVVGGAETVMAVNGVTFAVSALLLAGLDFGAAPARAGGELQPSLLREAREGMRATIGMRGVRIVVLGSSAALFCGGLFNVCELFFAKEDLGSSDTGFGVLVAVFGLGFVCGSLAGASGGEGPHLKRRYLTGLAAMGGGFLAVGLAQGYAVALATFAAAGFGNGLVRVYDRLLIQDRVPDQLQGRVFGVKDALSSWAFAIAFLAAGALLTVVDVRTLIVMAGATGLLMFVMSAVALREEWPTPALAAAAGSGGGADALLDDRVLRQDGAHAVGGGGRRGRVDQLEAADDGGDGGDDPGVELGPGVGR
jgi:MFS family permease